jgi:hypothetical protein
MGVFTLLIKERGEDNDSSLGRLRALHGAEFRWQNQRIHMRSNQLNMGLLCEEIVELLLKVQAGGLARRQPVQNYVKYFGFHKIGDPWKLSSSNWLK